MEDKRLYIVRPLSFWSSPRAQHLFKVKQSEVDDAQAHPQGIIREDEEHVLVIEQDPKAFILKEADEGRASEVLKRHNTKIKAGKKK